MLLFIKIFLSIAIILIATFIAKKLPSLGGLIAVMPLTGALVFLWVYFENNSREKLLEMSKGAMLGIIPSFLFFLALFLLMKLGVPFLRSFLFSFLVWVVFASLHQFLLAR
jgi:uncharacterized membrane protein (GlpM family)